MRWTLDQWRVFERWSLPRVGTCEDQTLVILVILVILVKMSDTCMVDIIDTCRHNNNNIENDDFVSNTTGCIRLGMINPTKPATHHYLYPLPTITQTNKILKKNDEVSITRTSDRTGRQRERHQTLPHRERKKESDDNRFTNPNELMTLRLSEDGRGRGEGDGRTVDL